MSTITFGEEYSAMRWIEGIYEKDGIEYDFSICVDDDDMVLDVTFPNEVPPDLDAACKEVQSAYPSN